MIGAVLGGCRIEAHIGRGGMARVYRARDLKLERVVALKILSADLADDEVFRLRFLQESQLAASIEHPNLLPIYAAGEENGLLYIAMRYVEGRDLRLTLSSEGKLQPGRALEIVAQVAAALDAAHARGLVHRDVKPANVLLSASHVYLSDFGVARLSGGRRELTRTGAFVGTLDYCAPEQIRNDPVDARTDIYSLGCLMFECLTGRVPFDKPTEFAVMQAHLMEEPPRPSSLDGGLGTLIDGVIATALSKKPDERFRTARHFVDAARSALAPAIPGTPRRSRVAGLGRTRAEAIGATRLDASSAPPHARATIADPELRRTIPSQGKRLRRTTYWQVSGIVVTALAIALVAVARSVGSSGTSPSQPPAPSPVAVLPNATASSSPVAATPGLTGRSLTLSADQLVMPPSEMPFPGYELGRNEPWGGYAWIREFTSGSTEYWSLQLTVEVLPTKSASDAIASSTCAEVDWKIPPTVTRDIAGIPAERKGCLYQFAGSPDWVIYKTGTRNVYVQVGVEKRLNSVTTTDMVNRAIVLANRQLAIVDRVAPPAVAVIVAATVPPNGGPSSVSPAAPASRPTPIAPPPTAPPRVAPAKPTEAGRFGIIQVGNTWGEVQRGGTLQAFWGPVPAANHFIALCGPGEPCSPVVSGSTGGRTQGRIDLSVPSFIAPGRYELRLYREDPDRVLVGWVGVGVM